MADSPLRQPGTPPGGLGSTTVRDIFALPEAGVTEHAPDGWKTFQEKISKEIKGMKVAAMPDLAAKMGELFDIPIADIFLTSWKKANVLQTLLEESKKTPETVMELELSEHTINSQHKPHIEVRVQNTTVKKLEFILRLVFRVKGFVLTIQNGAIKEMRTGICDARGTLEYQGLIIAEKKLAPIHLPALVHFEMTKEEKKPLEREKVEGAQGDKLAEPAKFVGKVTNETPTSVTETTEHLAVKTMTGHP
ncbi:MAG: hypothetical protein M3R69_11915 [Acidobacteriota bacterium]|nr:hypothetical protein [Acidobacteriota bacterium]